MSCKKLSVSILLQVALRKHTHTHLAPYITASKNIRRLLLFQPFFHIFEFAYCICWCGHVMFCIWMWEHQPSVAAKYHHIQLLVWLNMQGCFIQTIPYPLTILTQCNRVNRKKTLNFYLLCLLQKKKHKKNNIKKHLYFPN